MTGLYVYSNVIAFGAQNVLSDNMSNLTNTLMRLSTGLRINSGKDAPAGLVASEVLKSDIVAANEAITNTQRANSVMRVADSALSQINVLLNDIRVLVNESANTGAISAAEIAANQLEIDASLDSIDRIARSTNFQGKKLLDGSLGFSTVGVDGKTISDLQIHSANFGRDKTRDVTVKLFEPAKKAALVYYGTGVGNDTVVRIGGSNGSELFKFGAGTKTSVIAAAINALSDSTGVTAKVEGVAARGSITLSSTGANNDIVISANDVGFDNGNYTFRITKSTTNTNDAKIISAPTGKTPGIVEISLVGAQEQNFANFAGVFNIVTDANYDGGTTNRAASVNLTRGNENLVQFLTTPQRASGSSKNGVATIDANVTSSGTNNQHTSELNGWTIIVDNINGSADGTIDGAAKTVTFTAGVTNGRIDSALAIALGDSTGGSVIAVSSSITGTLSDGDRVTLNSGGDAGELLIQYKAGATVGQIQDLINNTPHVQATLVNGVNRGDVISNLPSGNTYMLNDNTKAAASSYSSSATAQTVIGLINNALGSNFTASALPNDTSSSGRITFQNASAIYGDVNSDNALRFTGTSGTIVRLVSQNTNGIGIANQQLGVKVVQPSSTDIANGISSPILQINLATDAAGNSITTARDIATLFDRLTATETLGISAELLLPSGVAPNTNYANFGNGIVNANAMSSTELSKSYVILLGNNEAIVDDNAYVDLGTGGTTFTISAKDTGTGMAGVKVYLFNDTNMPAWTDGNLATAAGTVDVTYDAGTKSLVVRANMGVGVYGLNAYTLAEVLKIDPKFSSSLFDVTTPYIDATDAAAANALITFDATAIQPSGTTSGGYRIELTNGQTASSGTVMTGQSDSNEHLILESDGYGRDEFVSVSVVEGFFNTYSTLGERLNRLAGEDAVATINGQRAAARGNDISTSQFSFEGSMNVGGMSAGQKTTFTISGGGAVFQLGADVALTQQVRLGIPSIDTGALGGTSGHLYQLKSGGNADMRTNTSLADRIVQDANASISMIRGRIGAVQRSMLDPNIQALQDNLEALVAAEADISNADFAVESSNLARYQILVQSAASVLGQANQLPQYAAMLVM
ncbi:MAG: hypothetical protein LBU65_10640 [Planctomycetaceae bacterium]|jgi:flagellin-like hook-associated protein FlgL|nr:hypothetical protein [Planctomycetaceae bacterium]